MQYGFAARLAMSIEEDAHDHATGLSEAPIVLYRASESRVSRPESLELTYKQLSRGNSDARTIEFSAKDRGHRHLFWQSLGAVGVLAAQLPSKYI